MSDRRSSGRGHPLRFLARNRYQLLGATLIAIILPAVIRNGFDAWRQGTGSMENTVVGTFAAMLFGAYLLRRMSGYPGVQTLALLLPAFCVSYGALAAILILTRLEYSRFQFLASFLLAILWFGFVGIVELRVCRQRFGLLPVGNAGTLRGLTQADWIPLRSSENLPDNVTGIVADLRAEMPPAWERFLARAALAGMPVYHSKQVHESLTGQVELEHLSENTFGSLVPSSAYLRIRRLLDFATAVLVLPVAAIVFIAVAIAVWIEDCGPVVFRQQRTGYHGRPFQMLKIRTMRKENSDGPAFTEADDQRITRVGRVLRRYRIDELPQVINILKGDMSWIGPRPEAVELAEWYEREIPFYSYRHIVRPGITGWAQVNQGNVAEVEAATDKLHYDFFYIKNFSPWLDLLIAAKTVRILLTGRGAR